MPIKEKRSQITIFILLAVIILVGVIFLSIIKSKTTKKEVEAEVIVVQKSSDSVKALETFITSCLDNIAKDGLELIGKQSGMIYQLNFGPKHILLPPDGSYFEKRFTENDNANTRFGISDGYIIRYTLYYEPIINTPNIAVLPPLGGDCPSISVECMLNEYIRGRFIDKCTKDNLKGFEDKGLEIKEISSPQIGTVISNDDVRVNLTFPLMITDKKTNDKYDLEKFSFTQPVRLARIYSFIDDYYKSITTNWPNADLKLPSAFASANGVDLSVSEFPEDLGFRVVIRDTKSKLSGNDYEFWFMMESLQGMRVTNFLREPINPKAFTQAFSTPEIEYVCFVDSDRNKIPANYFNTASFPEFKPIFDNLARDSNIFFITKKLNNIESLDESTCALSTPNSNCIHRLAFSGRLGQNFKIAPLPFLCYSTKGNQLKLNGEMKAGGLELSDSKGYPLTFSGVSPRVSFGRNTRGDDYFYDGFEVDMSADNSKIQSLDLSYTYDDTNPLQLTIIRMDFELQSADIIIKIPSSNNNCDKKALVILPKKERTHTESCYDTTLNIFDFGGRCNKAYNIVIKSKLIDGSEKEYNPINALCGDVLAEIKDAGFDDTLEQIVSCQYNYKEIIAEQRTEIDVKSISDCNTNGIAEYVINQI